MKDKFLELSRRVGELRREADECLKLVLGLDLSNPSHGIMMTIHTEKVKNIRKEIDGISAQIKSILDTDDLPVEVVAEGFMIARGA